MLSFSGKGEVGLAELVRTARCTGGGKKRGIKERDRERERETEGEEVSLSFLVDPGDGGQVRKSVVDI